MKPTRALESPLCEPDASSDTYSGPISLRTASILRATHEQSRLYEPANRENGRPDQRTGPRSPLVLESCDRRAVARTQSGAVGIDTQPVADSPNRFTGQAFGIPVQAGTAGACSSPARRSAPAGCVSHLVRR